MDALSTPGQRSAGKRVRDVEPEPSVAFRSHDAHHPERADGTLGDRRGQPRRPVDGVHGVRRADATRARPLPVPELRLARLAAATGPTDVAHGSIERLAPSAVAQRVGSLPASVRLQRRLVRRLVVGILPGVTPATP